MPDTPLSGTSPNYDKAENAIRSLLFDVAFDRVLTRILSAVPWLGYPVIKQLFSFLARKLLVLVYNEAEEGLALLVIQIRVRAEKTAYDAAVLKLKQGDMSDAAQEEFRRRLRDLIRIPPR